MVRVVSGAFLVRVLKFGDLCTVYVREMLCQVNKVTRYCKFGVKFQIFVPFLIQFVCY